MTSVTLQIVEYDPAHQPQFEKLNRDWIEKFFEMEPLDYEILGHPEDHIIKPGGSIFMARHNDEIVGTVALKPLGDDVYELTKMAVDNRFQGLKIGRHLGEALIAKARASGARKLVLYSNTMLQSAMALYRKLGFREVPVDGPYKRTNVKMELILS